MRSKPNDRSVAFAELRRKLSEHEVLQAVTVGTEEQERAFDHDLAAFVDHRLGMQVAAEDLRGDARSELAERAQVVFIDRSELDSTFASFWIHDGEQKIGSLSCSCYADGTRRLLVRTLYVRPESRRRGHAQRALRALRDIARSVGYRQVLMQTSWCVPEVARLCLSLGMWVANWKHELTLAFELERPSWRIAIEGHHATFLSDELPLLEAARRGNRLEWDETAALRDEHAALLDIAPGTFALALALEGWPLIRSDELWRDQLQQGFSDLGGPEGLAFKIRIFEAWARESG